MKFLDLDDLIYIAQQVVSADVAVRDYGLLDSAAARPQASAFGQDAYPTIHDKAAALLHSLVQNHALIDGNKRLGLAAVIIFYSINGYRLNLSNDDAYELVMTVASGELVHVPEISEILRSATEAKGH